MTAATPPRPGAAPIVRRVVVYTILFVLVVLTASGVRDLLGRLFDVVTGEQLAGTDTVGLAVSLTFTLIAGPLAAVLGWFVWRRLVDPPERASLAWALYLVGMGTLALVVSATALLSAVAAAVTAEAVTAETATGLVWAGVWAGHGFVLRRTDRRPTRLPGTAAVLGGTFGLVIGAGGAVTALTILVDEALAVGLGTDGAAGSVGSPWWTGAVQALVWAAGGASVWWWHWRRDGGRTAGTALAGVALVGVGILGGALLTLAGTGTVVFVLLRLAVDSTDAVAVVCEPLGPAIAAALVGGLIWVYHRGVVRRRTAAVRQASTLVTSGISLVAAATGLGVIVNALLATATTPLAGSDPRTLLLGGISSLLVGGPVWWLTWRPATGPAADPRRSAGRSVYLVVVFGISAIVALITLLVIGFRLFDTVLAGDPGLLDRIRAPLGLLAATALVAGYHFTVWRQDRAAVAAVAATAPPAPLASAPAAPPAGVVGELVLVMGPGAEPVVTHLRRLTGAPVVYWQRAGGTAVLPNPAHVEQALHGVSGDRVLLIVGVDGTLTVIPVAAAQVA
ncbi:MULTISPECIES: DUF5671 domain-containing protein [Cryobacterium]|uniref:DUF5671 domain-containing protein n=1 Tax=Cryobacterium TaxID=69578 RepID=UPI000CD46429|nr:MULTISPECIES: DUF5671 domain-containing protein [Cryobacterium]POH65230.1 hypothetical protein C3B60_13565 [Cryobacterium zongtaii]TFC44853.1 hypothetical protein E3O57_10885 [Cryobacterium sp. TMN-39-2]